MIEYLIEEGKKFFFQKEYILAKNKFLDVVRKEPDNSEAYFELGKAYLLMEDYKEAKANLSKSLEFNPENVYARVVLAKTFRAQGEAERAIEEFKKILLTDYEDENIENEISSLYQELGNCKKAIQFLKEAHKSGHNIPDFKEKLFELYLQEIRVIGNYNAQGEYTKAVAEIHKAKKLIPMENSMLQNILINEKETAEKKLILSSRVRSLTFTLTNKCNLRCLMCESRKKTWDLPDKTKEEIKKLMPYLERIMWQGGEAFMYEGFEELLDEASKFPIRQVLATNGLLMSKRMAKKLVRYNVELTFSIDGATKEVYEHIRPGASFEKVLEKVRMINELREELNPEMSTRLNVLIMRANCHQIETFLDFAKKYKFTTLFFNSAGCDFRNLSENIFYYNHDPKVLAHIDKIRDKVARKAREYGLRLENWLPSEKFFEEFKEEQGKEVINGSFKKPVKKKKKANKGKSTGDLEKLFCHAPWQRLYIDMLGKVRPDCLCPEVKDIGNLQTSSIEELWNSKKLIEYRRKIVAGNYKEFCNPDCVYGRVPEKNLKFI